MHHEFYQLAKIISVNNTRKELSLATIIHVRGSAYRREGTRMLIEASGNWHGNISGGCLEGDILKKAQKVIETQAPTLVSYDTREGKNKEIRIALGCNGVIDILIEPVTMDLLQLSEQIVKLFEHDDTAFLITELNGDDNQIHISRKLSATKPYEFADEAFEKENYCLVTRSDFKITLHEYIGLQRKLIIWGAGPDVVPLAQFAHQLKWKTVVASDCNISRLKTQLPNTVIKQCNFDDFISTTSPNENTALVLVSHDFYKDYFILEKVIQHNLKYIGIMGPKRRGERMIQEFVKKKPQVEFDQNLLHYPVGLDIGSDNPTEIALSIIAEIQSSFSGKDAAPLKEKSTPIHEINMGNPEEYNLTDTFCTINHFQ